jgi:hypothetical protein
MSQGGAWPIKLEGQCARDIKSNHRWMLITEAIRHTETGPAHHGTEARTLLRAIWIRPGRLAPPLFAAVRRI